MHTDLALILHLTLAFEKLKTIASSLRHFKRRGQKRNQTGRPGRSATKDGAPGPDYVPLGSHQAPGRAEPLELFEVVVPVPPPLHET